MTSGIGVSGRLHTVVPVSEAEAFDLFKLPPGEETIVTGAVVDVEGNLFFASRAVKREEELELYCLLLDQHQAAQVLKARRGCVKIFTTSASLAW
jgi:hypothetical protein